MITSLMRGIPSRETCVKGPVWNPGEASSSGAPSSSSSPSPDRIVALRRLADAQIPTTEPLYEASVGLEPLWVSELFGTRIGIASKLKPFVVSTPGAAGARLARRVWEERRGAK